MRKFRHWAGIMMLVPVVALGATATSAATSATSAASAATSAARVAGKFTFYPNTGRAEAMTRGPDGDIWYDNNTGKLGAITSTISRISPDGQVESFDVSAAANPGGINDIATGSDGAIWFTSTYTSTIGRLSTAGVVTTFPVASHGQGTMQIIAGADGALWFTYLNSFDYDIGRITTAGVATYYQATSDIPQAPPGDLTVGPDGAVWFHVGTGLGRITDAGVFTYYYNNFLVPIGLGPDGTLLVYNFHSSPNVVSAMTVAGVITETYSDFPRGPSLVGPDGNLWGVTGIHTLVRMTPTGVFTLFQNLKVNGPLSLIAGPNGTIWFNNARTKDAIGSITTTASF